MRADASISQGDSAAHVDMATCGSFREGGILSTEFDICSKMKVIFFADVIICSNLHNVVAPIAGDTSKEILGFS